MIGVVHRHGGVSTLLGFAMLGAFTLISNCVQSPRAVVGYGLSGTVLDVGLYALPSTVATLAFSMLASQLEKRLSTAYILTIGWVFVSANLVWLALALATATTWYDRS